MKNKLLKILCLVVVVLVFTPLLVGCQSTNKDDSYILTSAIENATFEYDSEKNQTEVHWSTTLSNNTIYNFKEFSIKFKLYQAETLQGTETYYYARGVKHGESYTGGFRFVCEGKIDAIEYVQWTADYVSFWETYRIWIIATVVVAGIASLIYIIFMIINDLELWEVFSDICDFFEDYAWVGIMLLTLLGGGTILGIISSNWVCVLIVLGGVISLIAIALLAHFIKWLICEVDWDVNWDVKEKRSTSKNKKGNIRSRKGKKTKDNNTKNDDFESYSVAELKAYCRDKGIPNYSGLSKNELIDLLQSNGININNSNKLSRKKQKITFNDIAGLENAKQAFKEKVVLAFEHKALYEKYGKKVGGGILLYGLPGTGKTMFAEAASNETDSLFIPIKCSDIKSKWYGESEANIKKIFNKARNAGKAIIFFDEFEAIGAKRTDNADNGNNDLVPEILAEMQGVNQKSNAVIVVIASTNKPWAIDSAFLRPGRFDEKIYIPLPDMQAREKLCELKLKNVPTQDLDYHQMAELTNGFNGADITEFCEKLKMYAIRESLASGKEHIINMEDVMKVSATVKSSVLEEDIENLKAFEDKF